MLRKYPRVSQLQVLESPAGFYIGRLYLYDEYGDSEPHSRESTYMENREIAENALLNKSYIEYFFD